MSKVHNAIASAFIALLLFLLLVGDRLKVESFGVDYSIFKNAVTIICYTDVQSICFLCFQLYLILLLFFSSGSTFESKGCVGPALLLCCVLFISSISYFFTPCLEALLLLVSIVIGSSLGNWAQSEKRVAFFLIVLLITALSLTSISGPYMGPGFEYHSQLRRTGPWTNPNVFGLLMAVGCILALGAVFSALRSRVLQHSFLKLTILSVSIIAIFMLRGLVQSLSRGAWLGAACGIAYLVVSFWSARVPSLVWLNQRCLKYSVGHLGTKILPLAITLVSLLLLAFFFLQKTDGHQIHRVFSSVNISDFSWRNRISAWDGALQIIADRPLFGAGWNQPLLLYENYYFAPRLLDSSAFLMNELLMLGATLGLPALVCFGVYLWLALTQKSGSSRHTETNSFETNHLRRTCRAGAIVLMIGFWFDGELFKLATGTIFWILLELGRERRESLNQ